MKPTSNLYIHADYNISHYVKCLLDEIFGIDMFINEIIWWFNSAPRRKKSFPRRHNTILRYAKTEDFYFDECDEIRVEYSPSAPRGYAKEHYYNPKGKVMDDVWRIWMLGQNDKTERVGYSGQKPEKLLIPIVLSSSKVGDTVADFFMGSGTTAVVSAKNDRLFIGCDTSTRACEIAKRRIESK